MFTMKTRNQSKQQQSRQRETSSTVSQYTITGRSLRSSRVEKTKGTRKSSRIRSFHEAPPISLEQQFQNSLQQCCSKRKVVHKLKVQPPSDICNFCNTNFDDEYILGELKRCEDITAHKFCLLFAPGLTQNGDFSEGIDGFLLNDIRKELKRGTHLKCSYCNKRGAVVGCAKQECEVNYHLPCGIQNGAFNNFHDERQSYPSYCKKHQPKLCIPTFKGRILCTICQEHMKNADRSSLLYFNCCQSYFHRDCLIKFAYHQGEFHLKCPNCKNGEEFVATVKKGGIYVPCRDATWELTGELNMTEVVFQCGATVCRCQNGREHNGDNEWELFSCDRCGSNAVHVACAELPNDTTEWVCQVCCNV